MKLIIDISDKTYEIIKDMVYFYNPQRSGRGETKEIITAIKQGIPLPKSHGRLIDGSKLEQFTQLPDMTFELLAIDIFEAPTIIEADKGD